MRLVTNFVGAPIDKGVTTEGPKQKFMSQARGNYLPKTSSFWVKPAFKRTSRKPHLFLFPFIRSLF